MVFAHFVLQGLIVQKEDEEEIARGWAQ